MKIFNYLLLAFLPLLASAQENAILAIDPIDSVVTADSITIGVTNYLDYNISPNFVLEVNEGKGWKVMIPSFPNDTNHDFRTECFYSLEKRMHSYNKFPLVHYFNNNYLYRVVITGNQYEKRYSMRVCSNTFRIDAKNPIDYLALTQNEINRYGKVLIDSFIKKIDVDEKGFIPFCTPGMWVWREKGEYDDMWKGCNYAFLIENILDSGWFNNVNRGIIIKRSIKYYEVDLPKLTLVDMEKIKAIYTRWWKKNKHKTIIQLQKEYKKKGSPLKGSKYKWF